MNENVKQTRPKSRREDILKEAASLFAHSGFAGTSISMIADAVGVSKAALFHHYKDKSAIHASIVTSVLEDICHHAVEAVDPTCDASEQLRQFMTAHGRFIDANFDSFCAAQFGFLGLTDPGAYENAMLWRDRYDALLRSIVARGVENGEFNIPDVKLAAFAVLSCLNWMARWYKPSGPLAAADIAGQYSDLLLNGFLNGDGAGVVENTPPKNARRRQSGG